MDAITSDKSLQVGDLVFCKYNKSPLIFKITQIDRRFITSSNSYYYPNNKIGDEYNPYITIEAVADLSMNSKKLRKTVKGFDASYLVRADPKSIADHIQKLEKIVEALWP